VLAAAVRVAGPTLQVRACAVDAGEASQPWGVWVLRVQRDQILAFRLASHHLTARLPAGSLAAAAAACGIQDTPLNTAPLAFHARVEALGPTEVGRALTADKSLLGVWSVRGAPHVVPSGDAGVFTAGALPADQASFGVFLGGWAASIQAAGLSAAELLDAMAQAAMRALDRRVLPVDELRSQIAQRVPALARLARPSGAHADLPEPLVRALGLLGVVCIAAEPGSDPRLARTDANLARTDRWLGRPLPGGDRPQARAELARRFLHCYGPATPRAFAEWTTRSLADARDAFALLDEELVGVEVAGTQAWVLAGDAGVLVDPPRAGGVRLLPPQDPYLQQRDRTTLLPDKTLHPRVWRPVRPPGVVLTAGQPVATWRSQRTGTRLAVTVEPLGRLPAATRAAIQAEADRIALLRDCQAAQLTIGT
jgi:Winged helix DNA-binding domain